MDFAAYHSSNRKEQTYKYARKLAFSKFVEKHSEKQLSGWHCCDENFVDLRNFHKHVALHHSVEIEKESEYILQHGCTDAKWSILRSKKIATDVKSSEESFQDDLPVQFTDFDTFPWLPLADQKEVHQGKEMGTVLLFYKYRDIFNVEHVRSWQETLCQRLHLKGKVRVSQEGLNATVGGSTVSTTLYVEAMIQHPLFRDMTKDDFKTSEGDRTAFPDGLKVGIYQEVVPMGIKPDVVSYKNAGEHLTPEEFHQAVTQNLETKDSSSSQKAVFVDCRNFYESKVGKFEGAVIPDIRKFSYWPEYVDANMELFKDKEVYMYCTGGIRCERGSAYLKSKGICKDVYQLQGGIHKYIEQYPNGHFRGKLFVFDDRYTIKANEDVISNCVYCSASWDKYEPCRSKHCHQLVLSCDSCREKGCVTCCRTCQKNSDQEKYREQCECTDSRPRIPVETLA